LARLARLLWRNLRVGCSRTAGSSVLACLIVEVELRLGGTGDQCLSGLFISAIIDAQCVVSIAAAFATSAATPPTASAATTPASAASVTVVCRFVSGFAVDRRTGLGRCCIALVGGR